MRRWILAGLLALAAPSGLAADSDAFAIRGVIQHQFDAFRADDAAAAFAYASPMIQGRFGTADNFVRMVESGYPKIWRPAEVTFYGLRDERGRLLQRVGVRDASGDTTLYDYELIAAPDGWRINGVYPVPQTGAGV
jgi:hypothetical protein